VWVIDDVRTTRFTFTPTGSFSFFGLWSPDGRHVAYTTRVDGQVGSTLRVKPATGLGAEVTLPEAGIAMTDWSRDGRFILVDRSPADLWVIPADGTSPPFPLIDDTPFHERLAYFSPDSQWVVYQSNESGRAEIYIRPFPSGAGQWQVSTRGGAQPQWSHDGKEIYWIAPDATLMAASVQTSTSAVDVGVPTPLFRTRIYMGGAEQPNGGQYDVSSDGRFLINVPVDDRAPPIVVVQNWTGFRR
jgi:dipeptidyl aminopeptidase/acylaminoacyl peptidase